jgi:signal transduction histidine kinase/integral membrane sensor domain MASE1/CheY-like chemotaxis protein
MTLPPTPATRGQTTRQAITYLSFAVVYFLLAAYAASMPMQARASLFIWPAHGLALGVLLVAPLRRWPVYLAIVFVDSMLVGWPLGTPWPGLVAAAAVNVAHPLVVAAGLLKLAGPQVEIGTLRGLAAFLVGMVPLVAAMAILDSTYSYLRYDTAFRQQWSINFFSTMLGMLLTAPLILAWSRKGYREALEVARSRWPELLVLFTFLIATTHYVFTSRPEGPGFIPPLAYLCAPFLIWAALRFGLRAAALGLAIFGLITYWHTGHGFGPFAISGVEDLRALLNLQGFLAVIIITTLFAAALVVERQEAIREIHDWRYRHERVIRASGSLLYDMDPVTGEVVWDGDTQAVLGTTRDRIATIGQWMSRVHPEDRPRLKGLREQLLGGQLSHIAVEYRLRRDDGEYTTLGVNGYRIADPDVDPASPGAKRIIGFVKDVSDKVRAEEERIRLEAQLKQAEKMQAVGHLAGGIAHDFNNILGAILGYGELAQGKAKDDDIRRYLDTIMHAGNRAKSLVMQILSYSRAEGAEKLPVIVAPVAEETCELVRGSSTSALDVRFRDASNNAAVLGDPTRLHQLFMNLCSNAVQAMDEAGTLEVVIETESVTMPRKVRTGEMPPGEYVRTTVKDTGHGIAPEVLDRIFEPFFTTKPAGQGTGLGLALVHAVVTEHHGFVEIDSRLGEGTTFVVWLPRAEGLPSEEPAHGPPPQGKGQVVLAVDDEPEVLAALEEMLASLGYEPAGFGDSREALASYRARPGHYEALVSDEVMPELTGTQLAIEIRRLNPALPILIASGYGGSGFETRALSAGVNRVLKKPYRMNEIAEVLASFFAAKPQI